MHREGEVCSTVAQTSTLDAVPGCDSREGEVDLHPLPHRHGEYEVSMSS